MSAALTEQEKSIYRIGESVIDVTSPPSSWEFSLPDVWSVLVSLRRYLGGSSRTVAEHSLAVSAKAREIAYEKARAEGCTEHDATIIAGYAARRGTWHDASEAFTGDVPGPMKKFLGEGFRNFEDALQEIVFDKAEVSAEHISSKTGSQGLRIVVAAVEVADAGDYRAEQLQGGSAGSCLDCKAAVSPYLVRCWPCSAEWKRLGFPGDGVFDEGYSADPPPEGYASSTPKPVPPPPLSCPIDEFDVEDLLEYHDELCDDAVDLMRRKNNDYAGASWKSPFKNFLHAETLGLCAAEQGMVVRLSDKLQRLAHFVSGQEMKVSDESLRDTLLDIVNYTVLIGAYLQSKKQD
jgi:hypothetical protein